MTAEAQKKQKFLEIIREPQWECCTFAIVMKMQRQFERKGTSLTARRPIARREKPKLENDTREPLTNLSTNTKTKHYGNNSNQEVRTYCNNR